MTTSNDLASFSRLVDAVEPWLDRVVIVGGWACRLLRLHPDAAALDYPPLITLDADVAVPAELPMTEGSIRQRLLDHGFTEELLGDDQPPAAHYTLGDEASGFYAEFLSPLAGDGYGRQGRKATAKIGGINSQP